MGSGITTDPIPCKSLIQDFFMSGDQRGLNPDPYLPSHIRALACVPRKGRPLVISPVTTVLVEPTVNMCDG
jgi:hypothetical protein